MSISWKMHYDDSREEFPKRLIVEGFTFPPQFLDQFWSCYRKRLDKGFGIGFTGIYDTRGDRTIIDVARNIAYAEAHRINIDDYLDRATTIFNAVVRSQLLILLQDAIQYLSEGHSSEETIYWLFPEKQQRDEAKKERLKRKEAEKSRKEAGKKRRAALAAAEEAAEKAEATEKAANASLEAVADLLNG